MAQAPGWFPDPTDANQQRYWDGHQWTANVQPLGAREAPHVGPPGGDTAGGSSDGDGAVAWWTVAIGVLTIVGWLMIIVGNISGLAGLIINGVVLLIPVAVTNWVRYRRRGQPSALVTGAGLMASDIKDTVDHATAPGRFHTMVDQDTGRVIHDPPPRDQFTGFAARALAVGAWRTLLYTSWYPAKDLARELRKLRS